MPLSVTREICSFMIQKYKKKTFEGLNMPAAAIML